MIRRSFVPVFVIAALIGSAPGPAFAQQTRSDLMFAAQAARDSFQDNKVLPLLQKAVNPNLGAPDSLWTNGVHLLVQALVEGNKPDLAKVWARWALRTSPTLKIDSVYVVAGAIAALRDGAAFTRARSTGDGVTRTSWQWPLTGSTEPRGFISVERAGPNDSINVRVIGSGLVPRTASGLALAPGSYEIEAAAPGFLPARISREVLPGVTTVLRFSLTPAAVASDIFDDKVRRHTFANVAALSVTRFGTPAACAAAVSLGREGLLLTSYDAIRAADSISIKLGDGPREPARVAAYDPSANLAILQSAASSVRADSISIAPTVVGQSVWGVRYSNCLTPTEFRSRVAAGLANDGVLQLSDSLDVAAGSPLIDVAGKLSGVWKSGAAAIPSTQATALLMSARTNIAQNRLLAPGAVSLLERHAYGSILVSSDVASATVKVTPLEAWQWTSLQSSGDTPLSFVGPMGRYRVEVSAPGPAKREQEVTLRPGVQTAVAVQLRTLAEGPLAIPPEVKQSGGSKVPWVLAAVGGVGVAAAVALMGGGGGKSTTTTTTTQPPPVTTGTITFKVPVNP